MTEFVRAHSDNPSDIGNAIGSLPFQKFAPIGNRTIRPAGRPLDGDEKGVDPAVLFKKREGRQDTERLAEFHQSDRKRLIEIPVPRRTRFPTQADVSRRKCKVAGRWGDNGFIFRNRQTAAAATWRSMGVPAQQPCRTAAAKANCDLPS